MTPVLANRPARQPASQPAERPCRASEQTEDFANCVDGRDAAPDPDRPTNAKGLRATDASEMPTSPSPAAVSLTVPPGPTTDGALADRSDDDPISGEGSEPVERASAIAEPPDADPGPERVPVPVGAPVGAPDRAPATSGESMATPPGDGRSARASTPSGKTVIAIVPSRGGSAVGDDAPVERRRAVPPGPDGAAPEPGQPRRRERNAAPEAARRTAVPVNGADGPAGYPATARIADVRGRGEVRSPFGSQSANAARSISPQADLRADLARVRVSALTGSAFVRSDLAPDGGSRPSYGSARPIAVPPPPIEPSAAIASSLPAPVAPASARAEPSTIATGRPSPAPNVAPAALPDMLAVAVASRSTTQLSLALEPAALGRVRIEIVQRGASVAVEIAVETGAALRAIETERSGIEAALRSPDGETPSIDLRLGDRETGSAERRRGDRDEAARPDESEGAVKANCPADGNVERAVRRDVI